MSYLKFQLSQLTENDILCKGENEFVGGEKDELARMWQRIELRFGTDFHSFMESVNRHLQSAHYVPGASQGVSKTELLPPGAYIQVGETN